MKCKLKACVLTSLLFLVAGCSSPPKRVDCEDHLRAINTPAPMKASEAVKP